MKKYAIIVAGGSGKRMQSELPKQFIEVAGKPILMHTIAAFAKVVDTKIILVLPHGQFDHWDELVSRHDFGHEVRLVEGGEERSDSVVRGLAHVPDHALVAIHDGVRPVVSEELILASYLSASLHGSGVAAVPLKDSIRETIGTHTVARDRSNYHLVQTPQAFQSSLIKSAYEAMGNGKYTDDASVFEGAGHRVSLVAGDYRNIKITTPEDLKVVISLIIDQRAEPI